MRINLTRKKKKKWENSDIFIVRQLTITKVKVPSVMINLKKFCNIKKNQVTQFKETVPVEGQYVDGEWGREGPHQRVEPTPGFTLQTYIDRGM